ncbi:hypothetical protein BX616_006168, partial [Lobosporangium transversale]
RSKKRFAAVIGTSKAIAEDMAGASVQNDDFWQGHGQFGHDTKKYEHINKSSWAYRRF